MPALSTHSAAAPSSAAPAGPSTAVVQAAAKAPGKRIEVIARFGPGIDAAHARAAVRAAGGTVTRDLPIIRALGVRMPAAAARDFAAAPGVLGVTLNTRVRPQAELLETADDLPGLKAAYPGSVRAPRAWNMAGVTGKGVGVAVIDTGIAGDMPDFRVSRNNPESRVVATAVLNPDATKAGDGLGHGTHIAGIIAGDSRSRALSDPVRTYYRGIAPDANLVDVKVSDDQGETSVIDVIYGLQFVADHADELGIRIVNLSLNSRDAESPATDPLDAAVEQLWLHGIVVVAAAGNRADAPDAVHYAPANDPYAITVGAVDDQGTKAVLDDQLAPWTSRGVTQTGVAKPEVLAPGAHMVATMPQGAALPVDVPGVRP